MTVKRKNNTNKQAWPGSRRRMILPAVFIVLSLLLMILPLESPVASAKAVLSYVFIPQIRAAHGAVEYGVGVSNTVKDLLDTHRENERLKEEITRIQLENAQAQEIMAENGRLTRALTLRAPKLWQGVWAKTTYREPTQWNSVIIDKGSSDGVQERSAAIAQKNGLPVLAGVVVETNEFTSKVLLLRDEDFAAAVYAAQSGDEGLLSGANAADLKMNYLPLLSTIQPGEKIYTSSSSSIFPAGILVGHVSEIEKGDGLRSSLTVRVKPEADALSVRELFILTKTEVN